MSPTRAGVLATLAFGAGLVAYALVALLPVTLPAMPWTLPAAIGAVAVAVVLLALSLRRRLRGGVGVTPVHPIAAARTVVLAKSCSHGGALLAGAYAGVAVHLALRYVSEARRVDALVSALSAVAALALMAAGLLLERFCRVQSPDDDPPPAPRA